MPFYRINWKEDCECREAEYLGEDGGGNDYYKCKDCDAVIIRAQDWGKIEEGRDMEKMEEEPKTPE